MKYLAALAIVVGLIAGSPVFAETRFPGILSSPTTVLSMCIAAAEHGVDVGHQNLSPNETYESIKIQAFLTTDGENPLVYYLVSKLRKDGDFDLLCYEAMPKPPEFNL